MADILVLGGGFGGVAAATTLRDLLGEQHRVTLVARDPRFAMGFAKLWELAGVRPLAEGTRSLHDLTRRGIEVRITEVTAIDPDRRRVTTTDGELTANFLIVALGAVDAPEGFADGQRRHNVYDPAALPRTTAAVDALDRGRVLVCVLGAPFKCPPAPFEAALAVAHRLRRRGVRSVTVTVAHPAPITLPVAGPEASAVIADAVERAGIELLLGHAVEEIGEQAVRFRNGAEVAYDLLLGVPVAAPPPAIAPLAAPSGWIEPDPATMRVTDRIFATGDCTRIPTHGEQPLPKAGVFAAAGGEVAARNIAAELGVGEGARFEGRGACYFEIAEDAVARIEGDFLAPGGPDVRLVPPSAQAAAAKRAYERETLQRWFGS